MDYRGLTWIIVEYRFQFKSKGDTPKYMSM